jgi:hypothetical protein
VLRADAEKWLEVADLILRSKKASRLAKWAIYCAGYAIEFELKARICDVLGVDELPADYETHDLNKLASHNRHLVYRPALYWEAAQQP